MRTLRPTPPLLLLLAPALASGLAFAPKHSAGAAEGKDVQAAPNRWAVGTPIVTYYAGPAMSEAVAKQMAEGGFNVVWCGEKDLDLLQRHGLRGMLRDDLLAPATLDAPERRRELDALIERV